MWKTFFVILGIFSLHWIHFSTDVYCETVPLILNCVQVSAEDPDLGVNKAVSYDFGNPSQVQGLLIINRDTGEIFTNAPLTGKGRREPYVVSVRQLAKQISQIFEAVGRYSLIPYVPYLQHILYLLLQILVEISTDCKLLISQFKTYKWHPWSSGKVI